MLVGGAITDRLSPRLIMLASDIIRLILTLIMLVLVWSGQMQVWMLYLLSFLEGIVSGFFIPPSSSIVPALVPQEDLQAGNSVFQGSSQLIGFVGPALAGVVISAFSGGLRGIAVAFAVDAVSFIASIVTLWLLQSQNIRADARPKENVWQSIQTGLRAAWNDAFLRLGFILIAFANLFFAGPLLVGIPVLANQRLPEGATAYRLILAAYAGGNFLGIIVCGMLPISQALASALSRWNVSILMAVGGVGMILLAVWLLGQSGLELMATPLAAGVSAEPASQD